MTGVVTGSSLRLLIIEETAHETTASQDGQRPDHTQQQHDKPDALFKPGRNWRHKRLDAVQHQPNHTGQTDNPNQQPQN